MIACLEVGGTHVSAAVVDPSGWTTVRTFRADVDSTADASTLLDAFADAAREVSTDARTWGVAMPDPFDYERGIGNFAGVAKFAALDGVAVGAGLSERLHADVVFLNDADAFVLGEWAGGVARGIDRCVGLTLGTGIGTGWLVGGEVVDPGVPAGGRIHTLTVGGRLLEDVVSRRALRREYAAAGGDVAADVREITGLARGGDPTAGAVVTAAYQALGRVLGPPLTDFAAELLVVGGSIAGSWDVLEPAVRAGAGELPPVEVVVDSDHAALLGAAVHASRRGGTLSG